jgi:hypothetical protein
MTIAIERADCLELKLSRRAMQVWRLAAVRGMVPI